MPYFSIVDDLKVGVRPYAYILYPKISIKMHLLLSVILPIHVKKQTKRGVKLSQTNVKAVNRRKTHKLLK